MQRKLAGRVAITLAAACLITLSIDQVKAEWKKSDDGAWSWTEEGGNATGWKAVDGKWYYFDENGAMRTDWVQSNNKWYYLDSENGSMQEGWIESNKQWYYLNSATGDMAEGWIKSGEKWYFLNAGSGAMATGWVKNGETWYFMDRTGSMQTGVVEIDGKIYALDPVNGDMKTGIYSINGETFLFDPESGVAMGTNKPRPEKAFLSTGIVDENSSISSNDSGSSGNSSRPSGGSQTNRPSGGGQTNTAVTINEVSAPRNGEVKVVLSNAVSLNASAFYVSCPTGTDMTILDVTTEEGSNKNKVYILKTAYYKDNDYILTINLPNNKKVEKSFTVRFDCPNLTNIQIERMDKTSAMISFESDRVGEFYYMAVENSVARAAAEARAVIGTQAPKSVKELISTGVKVNLEKNYNELILDGLKENTAYTFYYAAVDEYGKETLLFHAEIQGKAPEKPNKNNNTIVEANGLTSNIIEITFREPTSEKLGIEAFYIKCPAQAALHIGRAETTDQKTYTIYLQEGWNYLSNNTYNIVVTFSDGTIAEGKFYADYATPIITFRNLMKISENKARVVFGSDKAGSYYPGFAFDWKLPTVEEVLASSEEKELYAGDNEVVLDFTGEESHFYIVTKNLQGNIATFVDKRDLSTLTVTKPVTGNAVTALKPSVEYYGNNKAVHLLDFELEKMLSEEDEQRMDTGFITIRPLTTTSTITNEIKVVAVEKSTINNVPHYQLRLNTLLPSGTYRLAASLKNNRVLEYEFTID